MLFLMTRKALAYSPDLNVRLTPKDPRMAGLLEVDAADGQSYRFTPDAAWRAPDGDLPFLVFSEIRVVHWLAINLWDTVRGLRQDSIELLKRERGDWLFLELARGEIVTLPALGGAYLLLFNYLQWYVRCHVTDAQEGAA